MILCNFSNTEYHLAWYDGKYSKLQTFLKSNHLDGIELLLHGNEDISSIPKGLVKGIHMSYYPTWLEFYNNDLAYLEDFPDNDALKYAFNSTDAGIMVEQFKKDFEVAKKIGAAYMVFHVGHVRLKDAFTFEFNYSNKEILDATIEIVNNVFTKESSVELLFENLWWPGLNLLNPDEVEYFMSKINYENKGIMCDLSHLMLTKNTLYNFDEGIEYIHACLDHLGNSTHWIKGLHINGTLSKDYMSLNHLETYQALKLLPQNEQFYEIYKHISQMDQHMPLESHLLKGLIDRINPKYQMIEVVGSNRFTWENYVKKQLEFMHVTNT